VIDERRRNGFVRRKTFEFPIPVTTHVEGTCAIASNEVGQPKIRFKVMIELEFCVQHGGVGLEGKCPLSVISVLDVA
jgi:hypothetical protein